MDLYFIRHATAVSRSASAAGDDFERSLTSGGSTRFFAAAQALARVGALSPELVLTSPLVRARQTAELVCGAMSSGIAPVIDERLSAATFDFQALDAILAEHAQAESLAIVGHNPSFEEVLGEVIGGGQVRLRKGAIALVELAEPTEPAGSLVWLAPTQLFEGGRASRQTSG